MHVMYIQELKLEILVLNIVKAQAKYSLLLNAYFRQWESGKKKKKIWHEIEKKLQFTCDFSFNYGLVRSEHNAFR